MKVLGQDEVPMRRLLAHVLGGIAGKESSRALVNMILAEPEDEVRGSILDRLKERDDPGIVPQLVKALRSENVKVVNRAAWTLGNLGAITAVPQLVGALVTTEERIVLVNPTAKGAIAAGSPGPGPGAHGHEPELAGLPDTAGVAPGAWPTGRSPSPSTTRPSLGGGGVGYRRGHHTQPRPGAQGRDFQLSEHRGPRSPDQADRPGFRLRQRRLAAVDQGLVQPQSQARSPGPSTLSRSCAAACHPRGRGSTVPGNDPESEDAACPQERLIRELRQRLESLERAGVRIFRVPKWPCRWLPSFRTPPKSGTSGDAPPRRRAGPRACPRRACVRPPPPADAPAPRPAPAPTHAVRLALRGARIRLAPRAREERLAVLQALAAEVAAAGNAPTWPRPGPRPSSPTAAPRPG